MLALTFICCYKFISYISKKVSSGDVARKYKCPLKKFNTYVTKVDTYYSSAYVTATVGDFKNHTIGR